MSTELVAYVKANISDFKKKMNEVSQKTEQVGKRMQDLGKSMSKYVTAPIIAMGTVAVANYAKQEKAERKLAAAIRATGGDVNNNLKRFKDFASGLQGVTTVGDEVSLGMLQMATTMGLSADASERAVKNAIAMESAFGVSAESAMRYTAALEQGDATMLKRYIPALRDVKDESELVAKAQEILGNAFEVAKDDALTFGGQMAQLKNSAGDLMEEFGKVIAGAITPLIGALKNAIKWMQGLDDRTKKIIAVVGGLAAAMGPLMIVLGTFVKTILPALVAGGKMVAASFFPITAIVLGVYGAYKLLNIEASKTAKILDELSDRTKIELEIERESLKNSINKELENIGLGDKIGIAFNALGGVGTGVNELFNGIRKALGLESDLEKNIRRLSAVNQLLEDRKKAEEEVNKMMEEQKSLIEQLTPKGDVKKSVKQMQEIPEILDTIQTKLLDLSGIDTYMENLGGIFRSVESWGSGFTVVLEETFDRLGNKIRETRTAILDFTDMAIGAMVDSFAFLGEAIGGAFESPQAMGQEFLKMLAGWAQKAGVMLLTAGLAIEQFKLSLESLNGVGLIVAGGALIAAASAAKAALSTSPQAGGSGSSYRGGGSGGADLYGMRDLGQFMVNVTGTLRADGNELVTVIENENKRTSL